MGRLNRNIGPRRLVTATRWIRGTGYHVDGMAGRARTAAMAVGTTGLLGVAAKGAERD
jgi:hypothetical protein